MVLREIVFARFAPFDIAGVTPFKIFFRKIIVTALGGTEG